MRTTISLSARTLWGVAGLVVLLAVVWMIATGATKELVLIYGAVVVAEGMRPLVVILHKRKIPVPLAIGMIYLVAFAVLWLLGWLITAPLAEQTAQLVNEAPKFVTKAEETARHYQAVFQANPQLQTILRNAPSQVGGLIMGKASLFLQAPVYLLGLISNTFLLLLISFFWLTSSGELANFVLSLVPLQARPRGRAMFDDMSTKLGGYVRGVLINMFVIGILSGIGVRLLGIQFTFLLGVVAGITEAIPVVGPLLGGAAAVIVALLTFGSAKAVQVAILYLVIQQVEGNTLVPLVMNRAVNLNPLAIVVALLIGGSLLGIPGAILSLPTAALVQVVILHLVVPQLRARADGGAAQEQRVSDQAVLPTK